MKFSKEQKYVYKFASVVILVATTVCVLMAIYN